MKKIVTIIMLLSLSFCPLSGSQSKTTPPSNGLSQEQQEVLEELIQQEESLLGEKQDTEAVDDEGLALRAETAEKELADEDMEAENQREPVRVESTFIQLNRELASLPKEAWQENLELVQAAGINRIIIQWSVEAQTSYFEPVPEYFTETYPAINHIFSVAEDIGMEVVTGLSYDPLYWERVPARSDILDIYLRVRNTINLRTQEALLDVFDGHQSWTGYYITEEIDDINWRQPGREDLLRQFLLRGGRIIRERDDLRSIFISAFFRKRTAPSTFAENMWSLTYGTEINELWVQDGIGVELLSRPLIEPYYVELQQRFYDQSPDVSLVIELFEQVSSDGEPFEAEPALPARVKNQLENASMVCREIIVFSLLDYADPRRGGRERELYQLIQEWNLALPADTEKE